MRFDEKLETEQSIQQLRGREGVRVREAYDKASRETGVSWDGRRYDRKQWGRSDPVNRALSAANSCLYGICHAAIVTAGYSPALGFIHTGKQLSFVYDVADFYKTEITIPIAFREAAEGSKKIERRSRFACRDTFRETRLLARIIPDIGTALDVTAMEIEEDKYDINGDASIPGHLWDPEKKKVKGGKDYSEEA